jgi:hypothetical protein
MTESCCPRYTRDLAAISTASRRSLGVNSKPWPRRPPSDRSLRASLIRLLTGSTKRQHPLAHHLWRCSDRRTGGNFRSRERALRRTLPAIYHDDEGTFKARFRQDSGRLALDVNFTVAASSRLRPIIARGIRAAWGCVSISRSPTICWTDPAYKPRVLRAWAGRMVGTRPRGWGSVRQKTRRVSYGWIGLPRGRPLHASLNSCRNVGLCTFPVALRGSASVKTTECGSL